MEAKGPQHPEEKGGAIKRYDSREDSRLPFLENSQNRTFNSSTGITESDVWKGAREAMQLRLFKNMSFLDCKVHAVSQITGIKKRSSSGSDELVSESQLYP